MKFTPFKFQVPLAAGGIALMAFNYLQYAVPHGKGLIKLSDILGATLTTGQMTLYLPLIVLMFAFSIISLISTVVYLIDLVQWMADKPEYQDFLNSQPTKSVGIFVPIASLSMTANVILAPVAFFIPNLSSNLQALMLPGLIYFGFLWLAVFWFEFKALKTWLSKPIDITQLSFIWLIDAFAFGLVNLTGTGIAAISTNKEIATIAAFASLFTLVVGIFLVIIKLAYLIYLQIKADKLPANPILSAFFLVIPITCLFGFSFYRMTLYVQTYLGLKTEVLSFIFINFSYVITIGWGLFCLYLISDYLKKDFAKSEFSFPQWAMV